MEEGEPEVKRKKCYTKREALQKLEELSGNVAEVVGVYKLVNSCSHLLPQVQLLLTSAPLMQQTKIWRSTMTKLAAVFSSLEKKIYRLKADVKNRKFRHQPGRLEENIISCSQHSVLQSSQEEEELSQTFSQQTLRPSTYR